MELISVCIHLLTNLVYIGLVILLSIIAVYWWFSCQRISKCIEEIPGFRFIPVFSFLQLFKQMNDKKHHNPIVYWMQLSCGICFLYDKQRISKIWIAFRPWVYLYKPETVEVVLSSHSVIDKSPDYRFIHPWLGTGLLTSTGDKWRSRRKLLTPTFHFRILEDFIPVFNEQSEVLVQKMKHLTHEEWVDIVPLITACALDIICETAMGVTINAQHDYETDYIKSVHGITEDVINRIMKPWLWIDHIFYLTPSGRRYRRHLNILHRFTRRVIKEKKAYMIQQRRYNVSKEMEDQKEVFQAIKNRKPLLETLLEHHLEDGELTEEDIREEVDTFMFEGHDTITMAISWTLYNIGLRPDIQENLFHELESIFYDYFNRPVTCDDLKDMKYLECVIKEAMRLYPSVPFIAREVKQDIQISNYTLPPGTVCFILPYMLHRDSEVFPNPENFDPERFFPENSAGRHPYAYIPFSAGQRNCIGQRFAMMELKTILAQILRNFEVKSLDERDRVLPLPKLVLKNEKPLRLKLILRRR